MTALVAGDERVRQAHDAARQQGPRLALEPYMQARIGGNIPPETTGNFVAVMFAHNSARPVDGYSAPQVHTHVVIFNMTKLDDGDVRPVQPRELFRSQQFATAVYRSELASRLIALGYQVERGEERRAGIVGYSPEYLKRPARDASRSRSAWRAETIRRGRRADRRPPDPRGEGPPHARGGAAAAPGDGGQVRQSARAGARGRQPRPQPIQLDPRRITADAAVTFAKDRNIERDAVMDERHLLRDALVALDGRPHGRRDPDALRMPRRHA